jgi:putative aldouronate transport system substrate-binding protein
MSLQEVFTYGSSGTFHPLTEYVESSMPNLGQKLAENPTLARQLYMPDGEVYALPEFQNCYQCQYSKRAYVYEPWLEELGMDRPTTTDEFREMLIAFRDEDPNRNGLQDEIPYMTATTGWESSPWEFLMSSFIYTTRNDGAYLMRDGGEVRFVANTPEWREGLRYMTGLVEDGLLAPESFVQQNDQLRALVENEDAALVGVTHGGFPGVFTVVGGETGRYRNYDTLAPLEGPNGVRQTWHQPASLRPHTKVTVAEERPDIVAQWADFFYGNLSNYLLAKRYWVEGEDYRFTTPDEQEELITADATPALAIPNEGSARYGLDQYNDSWGRTAPRFIVAGWEALVDLDDPLNFGARLMRSVRDRYEPYKSDNWMPSGLIFEPAVTDELADLEEAITADTGIVERWSTQFVVGERDINDDEEWNDYLNALERAGVERYVDLWDQRVRAAGFLD